MIRRRDGAFKMVRVRYSKFLIFLQYAINFKTEEKLTVTLTFVS